MRLGQLIKALELLDPENQVQFDFCGFQPGRLTSYRGYYDELALTYCDRYESNYESNYESKCLNTVGKLLKECKEAVGKTFIGYKGGDYVMDKSTPVCVAAWGPSGGGRS